MSTSTLAKFALISRKDMFKIGCYFLIVQAAFIYLRNIWEDTDRSIIILRKLSLFLCGGTMSACFSSLENFEN